MVESTVPRPKLIRTPAHKIPIGEPFKTTDGHYGIRIKKPKCSEYEDLPLDQLISMVVMTADSKTNAEQVPRSEGTATTQQHN